MKRSLAALVLAALAAAGCGRSDQPKVAVLTEKDKAYVRKVLNEMKDECRLVFFTTDGGCKYCEDSEAMMREIAAQAPKVRLEVLDLRRDAARAKELGIDKVPAMAFIGKTDQGLRYFGHPGGYEFIPFVETILAVANNNHGLTADTAAKVAALTKPVTLSVFVTQQWPYCPASARVAYGMAMAGGTVSAEVIDAEEFPDIAQKFRVSGVPKTVINAKTEFVGNAPEAFVLEKVLSAP